VPRFSAPAITEALRWALTQAGKPYDFSAICGIAFERDWHDSRRWFCSELIAAAFEVVGSPLLNPSANLWRITPRDRCNSFRSPPYPSLTDRMAGVSLPYAPLAATRNNSSSGRIIFEAIRIGASAE
jgi:hypothetical protein